MRNICDNKVSGHISTNSSNHNVRLGSDGEYVSAAHRLGSQVGQTRRSDVERWKLQVLMNIFCFIRRRTPPRLLLISPSNPRSLRVLLLGTKRLGKVRRLTINCLFMLLRCSPAPDCCCVPADSRPPLIVKTRPADVPPGGASDALYSSDRRKKRLKGRTKEETENLDKNTLYGIVSSSKDSARLTLKLTRMKSPDGEEAGELPPQAHSASDQEMELLNPGDQFSRNIHVVSNEPGADETENCEQTPVCSNAKDLGEVNSSVFEDGEMDAMVDAERTEREAAGDKERWSKEVQDKGTLSAFIRHTSEKLDRFR